MCRLRALRRVFMMTNNLHYYSISHIPGGYSRQLQHHSFHRMHLRLLCNKSTDNSHKKSNSSAPNQPDPKDTSPPHPNNYSPNQNPKETAPQPAHPSDHARDETHHSRHISDMWADRNYLWKLTEDINTRYYDLEHMVMAKINMREKDQKAFRLGMLAVAISLSTVLYFFGGTIFSKIKEQFTGLFRDTLENKEIKIQAQELATAVVQTVLNDKDVMANAAVFLQTASQTPETQQALQQLAMHVLEHPESIAKLSALAKCLIKDICEDKETMHQVSALLTTVFQDPKLKMQLSRLVYDLTQDAVVYNALGELVVKLAAEPYVISAVHDLLQKSASDLLEDQEIASQSREFIADVMGDDRLQREGGTAIWNSVYHALKPGVIRSIGIGLIVVSVGFARIMFSPF